VFDRVSKGWVTEVAGEGNGLGQVFIQAEGATKGTGEGSDFDGVGETGTDMIARAVEGKLGFIFERAKSGAVNDAFAIALKFWAEIVGLFRMLTAETFPAFRGVAAEQGRFPFFPVFTGVDRHLSGMDGSGGESRDGEN
jgi:hypothetical protein